MTAPTDDAGGERTALHATQLLSEEHRRGSFFEFTVRRPIAISMVVLAVCVFGVVGLLGLPVNLLPDVSYPSVTVRTTYPGASPRDVEERISERVQQLVSVVPGVRRVFSVSRPGVSDVVLEFGWGSQMSLAVNDVRERLDRFFSPAGADRPLVLRYDPSLDPVLTLGITATDDLGLIELRHFADHELEERLAQIDGVAAVKLRGGDEEEIRVAIDEQALAARGIDIGTVATRLQLENVNAAAGSIEEGRTEYLVRTLNEYRNLDEIEDTILEVRSGTPIRLREVASVRRVPADPEVVCRIGGRPCVLVDLYKEAGANIVAVCAELRERVFGTEAQQRYVAAGRHLEPLSAAVAEDRHARQQALRQRAAMTDFLGFEMQRTGIEAQLLVDQSTFIEGAIDEVRGNALQGGLLAIVVIFLFLRSLVATAILAVSIPLSLLATFAPMFLSGIDLNVMSLGGLALGVGMLVDNSIVVLESIQKRREAGDSPARAAVTGTSRVASAVVASTLTTVAVFFPIVFVEGLGGQLFRDQALTVVYALGMSLLVALFVVPMLASRGGGGVTAFLTGLVAPVALEFLHASSTERAADDGAGTVPPPPAKKARRRGALFALVDGGYQRLLRSALRRPWTVVAIALLLLASAAWRGQGLGQQILPEVHQGEFWVEAFLPRSATVRTTDRVLRDVEARVRQLPDVARTFLASGVDPEELNDSEEGKHSGRILVTLQPTLDRAPQEERARAAVAALLDAEPAIQSHRFQVSSVLQFHAGVTVEILGHDLEQLREACDAVAAELRLMPSLRDVRSSLQRGNPELTIRFDRDRMAAFGLDAGDVARILRTKVQGDVPTLFAERERKLDIRVRADRQELDSEQRLRYLNVNPDGYPEIPLQSVAEIVRREGPSEIRRLGNARGAEVQAAVHGFDLGGTQDRVEAALTELELPRGVHARLGGDKEELERSSSSLMLALLLAVFLVYVVMASQFESIVQPLVILVSVPLALVGVTFALDLLDLDVSVIVFLGAIVLAGIVVNNAIILIDQTNRLREEGLPLHEAVVEGCRSRLRPVLMTTTTTLLGLLPQTGLLTGLPLFGGTADGIELRAPMAVTVIAGLGSSTLLTLVLVPVVYTLVARRRAAAAPGGPA
ncbi:MAG: efflux RND transporter permease subunit [Planctomycetota bacterium]